MLHRIRMKELLLSRYQSLEKVDCDAVVWRQVRMAIDCREVIPKEEVDHRQYNLHFSLRTILGSEHGSSNLLYISVTENALHNLTFINVTANLSAEVNLILLQRYFFLMKTF